MYEIIGESHAIVGNELVDQKDLLVAVSEVQPTLPYKYKDLKEVMGNILKHFQDLKRTYTLDRQARPAGPRP